MRLPGGRLAVTAFEESAQVDPAAEADAFLQEHGQMCRDHWKEIRRDPQRKENMRKLGCMDDDGQPLQIQEETLKPFLTFIAANLNDLATKLTVRDTTMKNVAVIAFGALKELTSGYMKLDIYDGLLQKKERI